MVRNALLSPEEHWLAQGFPHPDAKGLTQKLKEFFPFPQLVAAKSSLQLSISDQKSMSGNSMHWAQLGSWLLFNIA